MKITKSQLKQIIKEELETVLSEGRRSRSVQRNKNNWRKVLTGEMKLEDLAEEDQTLVKQAMDNGND